MLKEREDERELEIVKNLYNIVEPPPSRTTTTLSFFRPYHEIANRSMVTEI